ISASCALCRGNDHAARAYETDGETAAADADRAAPCVSRWQRLSGGNDTGENASAQQDPGAGELLRQTLQPQRPAAEPDAARSPEPDVFEAGVQIRQDCVAGAGENARHLSAGHGRAA